MVDLYLCWFLCSFSMCIGLICSEGEMWREHRRFVMAAMKQLGMGRSGDGRALMEARIMDRVVELVEVFFFFFFFCLGFFFSKY